jgi:hypothetical protein
MTLISGILSYFPMKVNSTFFSLMDAIMCKISNTKMEMRNLVLTLKHGGVSVVVWGCMTANGAGT